MGREESACFLWFIYSVDNLAVHNARASCYVWGRGCHLRRPGQAGGMCWQEPCKSQQGQVQGPAPGKDKPPALVPAETWLERAALLKSPWASWQTELSISQQSALAAKRANNILGCVTRCRVGRWKKPIIPSFLSTHWTPLRVSCSVLDPPEKKRWWWTGVSREPLKWPGLEHSPWKGWRLRPHSAWGRDSCWEEPTAAP